MKVLIVNCYGSTHSTGKITTLQYRYLKDMGHEVRVCYRGIREPKMENPDYVAVAEKIEPVVGRLAAWLTGYEGYTHPIATLRLVRYTDKFKPDIVQLNILHGYFINSNEYITYLKEHHYKVCYTMMDEYAYMGKCPFSFQCNQFMTSCKGNCPAKKNYPMSWIFDRSKFIFEGKRKAYAGFKNIVFTGPRWVVERAKSSALLRNCRVEELDEPVDFGKTFYPREADALRKKLGIPKGNKVIVTVAPLSDPRKGGKYVFEVAKKLESHHDITFVYVGCNTTPPFDTTNLIKVPFVSDQNELATYYSLGDLFVCTSLADTMPNVCIDALGCGTPLAGFAAAGTPYVATPEFGTFTPTCDIDALAKVIEDCPKKDTAQVKATHAYAVRRYAPEVIIGKLENIYKTLQSYDSI